MGASKVNRFLLIGVFAFLVCFQIADSYALSKFKKSLPETETEISNQNASMAPTRKPQEECTFKTPCGWSVFNKLTGIKEYFLKNTCKCAPEKMCTRDVEDISITAFVYRCKTEEERNMEERREEEKDESELL